MSIDPVLEALVECRAQLKVAIHPMESTEWSPVGAWGTEWRPWIRLKFPSEFADFEALVTSPKFTYPLSPPRFDRTSVRYSRHAEFEAQQRHQELATQFASSNRARSIEAKEKLLRFLDGLERLHKSVRGSLAEAEQLLAKFSAASLPPGEPIRIFFSYSHEDKAEALALEEHLSGLKRQNLVDAWHDGRIAPGDDWSDEIRKNFESSQIILLFVSSSFLASDYCYSREMKRAIERRERGEAVVVPVVVRPCDWKGSPFAGIQMLPSGANPITAWTNRDAALADVAQGIRAIVEGMASRT